MYGLAISPTGPARQLVEAVVGGEMNAEGAHLPPVALPISLILAYFHIPETDRPHSSYVAGCCTAVGVGGRLGPSHPMGQK